MIRAVLFDMDGVLVDSFEVWWRVMNDTARYVGAPPIAREQIVATWGQGIRADVEIYYPSCSLEQIEASFAKYFTVHLEHLITMPGALDLFDELAAREIATAVVTNTPRAMALDMLVTAGLAPDIVVGGTEVPFAKPAPDMVNVACCRLKVDENEVILVGDSSYDREAADAASVRFIGYGGIDAPQRVAHLDEIPPFLERRDPEDGRLQVSRVE